jgi:ElaB/YqjD/DUF883 family membrane-anchored ribosome-binding protein
MKSDGRSPEAIEQNIVHTRARLESTIDAIGSKLSPVQLISEVLAFTRAGGGELAGSVAGGLATAARSNPLAVTLLTLGAGWLMMADRTQAAGNRAQHAADDLREKMHDAVDKTQDKARAMMDRTDSTAQDMREKLAETRDSAMDAAQKNYARLEQAATDLLEQNPLAAGALMVAVGALIGGALPVTNRERELFGRSGEKARAAARSAVERGAEAARDIAGAAMAETREAVEELGAEARSHEPALH